MQAQDGRTYAQIAHGKIHWLFTASELLEWNNDMCPAVDVTDIEPKPLVGYLYDGGLFREPVPEVIVSNLIVSPRQIRKALTDAGYREVVELSVANGTQELKDWWEYATQFEEQHPEVVGMAANLSLTDAQRHDLFVLAASL